MPDIKGTTKLIDFSQEKLLAKLIEKIKDDPQSKERIEMIKGGICYMLAIEWIRKGHEIISPKNVEMIFKQPTTDAEYYYFLQVAQNFIQYYKTFIASTKSSVSSEDSELRILWDSPKEIAEYFVFVCSSEKLTAKCSCQILSHTTFSNYITNDKNNMWLLRFNLMRISDNRFLGGHATAIIREGGETFFFDPNYGVYHAKDLPAFFRDLTAIYSSAQVRACGFTLISIGET